jgi:hypothetical protein
MKYVCLVYLDEKQPGAVPARIGSIEVRPVRELDAA